MSRMPVIILCLFRFVRLLGSGHQAIAVEKLALRLQLAAFKLQLAAFKRKRKRPVLTQSDRPFWGWYVLALQQLAGFGALRSAGYGRPLAEGAVPGRPAWHVRRVL